MVCFVGLLEFGLLVLGSVVMYRSVYGLVSVCVNVRRSARACLIFSSSFSSPLMLDPGWYAGLSERVLFLFSVHVMRVCERFHL